MFETSTKLNMSIYYIMSKSIVIFNEILKIGEEKNTSIKLNNQNYFLQNYFL